MGIWEQFRDGYQAARHGNGGCSAVGRRYPGCTLDAIEERQRAAALARAQNKGEPPLPEDTSQLVANVTERMARLEAENAELRDVLAGYVERADQHQRALADATERSAMLTAHLEKFQLALAERDAALAKVTAFKDRFQAKGKLALAHCREMESLLKRPDVKKALQKTLHQDAHPQATAPQRLAYDRDFAALNAVYERIEARR